MIDAEEIYQKLCEAGYDWAEKNRIADKEDKVEKIVIAMLGNEIDGSMAAKEAYAKSHARYKEHVDKMTDARCAADCAKVEYESRKAWLDAMRTNAATERAANKFAT